MDTGSQEGVRGNMHTAGPEGPAHTQLQMWEMGLEIHKEVIHKANYYPT